VPVIGDFADCFRAPDIDELLPSEDSADFDWVLWLRLGRMTLVMAINATGRCHGRLWGFL
jgi:hypothetical protein